MTKHLKPLTLAILGLGLLSLLLFVPRGNGASPVPKRPSPDRAASSVAIESLPEPSAMRDPARRAPTVPGVPAPQTKRLSPGANPLDKLAKSITATPPG